MVEAEEEYTEQMEILVSCFLRPFKMAASSKKPPCNHEDVNSIFLNSETVLFLHQIFLKGLTSRMESWPTLVLGEHSRARVSANIDVARYCCTGKFFSLLFSRRSLRHAITDAVDLSGIRSQSPLQPASIDRVQAVITVIRSPPDAPREQIGLSRSISRRFSHFSYAPGNTISFFIILSGRLQFSTVLAWEPNNFATSYWREFSDTFLPALLPQVLFFYAAGIVMIYCFFRFQDTSSLCTTCSPTPHTITWNGRVCRTRDSSSRIFRDRCTMR